MRKYEHDAPSPVECETELGALQPEYFRSLGSWQKRCGPAIAIPTTEESEVPPSPNPSKSQHIDFVIFHFISILSCLGYESGPDSLAISQLSRYGRDNLSLSRRK